MHEAGVERAWQIAHLPFRTRVASLICLLMLAISAMLLVPPLPQSPSSNQAVPLPAVTPVDMTAPAPVPAPAVPAPAAPAPSGATDVAGLPAPAATPVSSLPLKKGMRGPIVRDLQRELRRRGARIAVDGAYGPGTLRAVVRLQARFGMPTNGRADARLLRRLGLQSLSVAGTSIPVPVQVSSVLPSWVRMDIWPTSGEVTSPFGMRGGRMHEGVDIANNDGPPVYAALAGTVSFVGWEDGYGNLVKISHGNGLETRYGHLASISAVKGQQVAAGTEIGIMGSTGRSTGTHLHFEIRVGGIPYNPLGALPPRAQSR